MSTALHEARTGKQGSWVPEWTLADRFRKVRQSTGLGQREFAAHLEVTAGAYQQWEADNSRPRNVVAIAKRVELLTGVPAAWLLGVEPTNPRPDGPDGGGEGWARWDSNPQPTD